MDIIEKGIRVFLGGTCGTSTWRDELISKLEPSIGYYNPMVPVGEVYTEANELIEESEKKDCNFHLYVITSEMTGVYSVAEIFKSNSAGFKTILCVIRSGFTDAQLMSLDRVEQAAHEDGVFVLPSLVFVADFLNDMSEKYIDCRIEYNTGDYTMVVSAFPGCGKTTFTNMYNEYTCNVLDSDSSKFSWIYDENGNKTDVRNPDFPNNYIEHIKENLGKVDIIFVSSHEVVHRALEKEGIRYLLAYPYPMFRGAWCNRLIERGDTEEFVENVRSNWFNWMESIVDENIEPRSIQNLDVLKSVALLEPNEGINIEFIETNLLSDFGMNPPLYSALIKKHGQYIYADSRHGCLFNNVE